MIDDLLNKAGIYQIVNTINNKRYIGQAQKIRTRNLKHKRLLQKKCHPNKHLQSAWNKYGADVFDFQVIEYCTIEELDEKERYYIYKYQANNKDFGYNIRIECLTNRGLKWSEEQRRRMREVIETVPYYHNHTISEKTRQRCIEANRNRIWTEEERKQQSIRLKGTKVQDTSNMKKAQRGENNPSAILTEDKVKEIWKLLENKYCSQCIISQAYSVSYSTISAIQTERSWQNINKKEITEDYFKRGKEKIEKFKNNTINS